MDNLFSWSYSGVDFNLSGTGGSSCTNYLPNGQKISETLIVLVIASLQMWYMFPHISVKPSNENGFENHIGQPGIISSTYPLNGSHKQLLLVVLCIVFGIELGFKLASKQFIWVLNPCHIVTVIQIYLLAASAGQFVAVTFRIQIHLLSGVMIAVCFPVVNTRLLPGEVAIYWVQHVLLLIIPLYLMKLGAPYTVELLSDFSWSVFVLGLQQIYHFIFLQAVSMMTDVNLNNIVCPAISDPFNGPWYRMWAVLHQSALVICYGKCYVFIASILGFHVIFSRSLICGKQKMY